MNLDRALENIKKVREQGRWFLLSDILREMCKQLNINLYDDTDYPDDKTGEHYE